jgi:hypothetical protein
VNPYDLLFPLLGWGLIIIIATVIVAIVAIIGEALLSTMKTVKAKRKARP